MKRFAAILVAAALTVNLSGCSGLTIFSNYRKLEGIELVRTITMDKSDDGVSVTVCGTAGESGESRMYEKSGSSVGVALGELQVMALGRQAILSHTESVLIGEALAAEDLNECLDYVERYAETRLDTGILVVKDGTAKELVAGMSGSATPASDIILGFDENVARVGDGYIFTCREIASSLTDNGCALIMCVRGVKAEKLFEGRGDMDMEAAGFAVAQNSGIKAYLTERETTGTMILISKLKSKTIDVDTSDTTLTVTLDSTKTDIKPVFSADGKLERLSINVDLEANIVNISGDADIRNNEYRLQAERDISKEMLEALRASVTKSQKLGLDYLGLEGFVHRAEPLKTEDMPESWDDIFPTLPVDIKVESILSRTYDIINPPEIAGEEGKPWEDLTELLKGS